VIDVFFGLSFGESIRGDASSNGLSVHRIAAWCEKTKISGADAAGAPASSPCADLGKITSAPCNQAAARMSLRKERGRLAAWF
jgi:hypothetical protein